MEAATPEDPGRIARRCRRLAALALVGLAASGPVPAREPVEPVEPSAFGPRLVFSRFSTEDGLSQSSVLAVHQDRAGFLWLGTENGLNRFDGRRFRTYRAGVGEPAGSAPSGRIVRALVEDADGRLWVATEGRGVSRFEPATETFEHFRHDPADPGSLPDDLALAMALDRTGRLWVGTRAGGLARFDAEGESFERVPTDGPCAPESAYTRALFADDAGGLFVGTARGVYHRRPDPDDPSALGCFGRIEEAGDVEVQALRVDRRGRLWVGHRDGLDRLDPTEDPSGWRAVAPRLLAGETVAVLHEERDAPVLWAGTEGGGLVRLDLEAGPEGGVERAIRYRGRLFDSGSLRTDSVVALHEDRAGVLWVGLEQGGLASVTRSRRHFGAWHAALTEEGPRALRGIFALHVGADATVWIGTRDQGLFGLDRRTGEARHAGVGRGLDSDRVTALAGAGETGGVLVGTVEGSLYEVDPEGTIRRLPFRSDRSLRALARDESGGVWIGTWSRGLHRLDASGEAASVDAGIVLCLALDESGGVWIGTWQNGLRYLPPGALSPGALSSGALDEPVLLDHRHDPGDPASLSSDRVAAVLVDRRGRVWIGTENGLDRLVGGPGEGARFERREALVGSVVYALLEDAEGHLWASGNQGLRRFDPETGEVRGFRARHGLQADEFNVGAAALGVDGELLFGGVDGLNVFVPGGPATAPPPPAPLVLTDLVTPRRRVPAGRLRDLVDAGDVLELGVDERSVTLEFAALDLADATRHRYAYRLEGEDADWIEAGGEPRAFYGALSAGRHTLRVRATSETGGATVDETNVALDLAVSPTFFERPSVRALVAVLAFAMGTILVFFGHRLRLRQLVRAREEEIEVQRRLLEARENERLSLARDLHDGPLQRLHALQLASSRRRAGPDDAERVRRDLAELVEDLRSVCLRLRSPVLQLFGLASALRDHAERFAADHPSIDLRLDLPADEVADPLPQAVRQALFRVAQEALSNAARHGRPKSVTVRLRYGDEVSGRSRVRLTVRDDGVGFTPPGRWVELARRGHLGVLGMAERIASIGGTLDLRSRPGEGTSVEASVEARVESVTESDNEGRRENRREKESSG